MHIEKTRVLAGSLKKLMRRSGGSAFNMLKKLHPGAVAEIMRELNPRDQFAVFKLLQSRDLGLAGESLNEIGLEVSIGLLTQLPKERIAAVLQELDPDDRAEFISALPEDLADSVLELMRVEESAEVQELLQYREETAGRIMSPNVFSLLESQSVSEAINIIQSAEGFEMVFYVYVVDARNHLVGVVSLRQLLTVPPSTPLKKAMTSDVLSVSTQTDQEEVARLVALYDILAIPVVDSENKLVGVVTVDDVIDVIKDEATEDILALAGVEADDHLHANASSSVKKRLPWLVVNLGMAMLAATIVALYEPTIAALPILAIFLPVVAGMGGNSGTQALTVTVRGLALGEISWKNARSVVGKETLVGVANGLTIGFLAGVVAYVWKGNPFLGVVLGGAMIANMFVAGILGTLIPLLLKKLNVDPAIASGIFLHTSTDIVGFFSFLGLATLLLNRLST